MIDIQTITQQAARADLARARRYGSLFITGTQQGLLELAYTNGTYVLTKQGGYGVEPATLATGAARFVVPVLAEQYVVVEEG